MQAANYPQIGSNYLKPTDCFYFGQINLELDRLEYCLRQGKYPECLAETHKIFNNQQYSLEQRYYALLLAAEALLCTNNLPQAQTSFQEILKTFPTCAEALTGLARLALKENNLSQALSLIQAALNFIQDDSNTICVLAQIQDASGLNQAAWESYKKAHNLNPLNQEAVAGLTALGFFRSKLTETSLLLKESIKEDPINPTLKTFYAASLAQQGFIQEAKIELTKILLIVPEHKEAQDLLNKLSS